MLADMERVRAQWRSTARPAERDELAQLLVELYVSLCEHLDASRRAFRKHALAVHGTATR